MKVHSARLLNERTGWFGLSVLDLAIVGYSLIFSDSILRPFGFELGAFLIAGGVFLVLLNIRLRSRPKTIRDFLRFKFSPSLLNPQIDQKVAGARRRAFSETESYVQIRQSEGESPATKQTPSFHHTSTR